MLPLEDTPTLRGIVWALLAGLLIWGLVLALVLWILA